MLKRKKPIASYKKAFQSCVTEAYMSLFGGGTPTGGVQTNHPKGYVTGHSTPNLGHAMTGPTGFDIDMINKEEELMSRAPKPLPFPLDTVFDHLVDAVSALARVDRQMKSAIENNVTLPRPKLLHLKQMEQSIADHIEKLVDLGKRIEEINITDL